MPYITEGKLETFKQVLKFIADVKSLNPDVEIHLCSAYKKEGLEPVVKIFANK